MSMPTPKSASKLGAIVVTSPTRRSSSRALSFLDEKLQYDVFYLGHQDLRLALDLRIIEQRLRSVIGRRGG